MNPIDMIRAAIEPDASPEVRAAGVDACRAVLKVLDPAPATQSPMLAAGALPQLVGMLSKLDLDQVLDKAIARLRALEAARSSSPQPSERPRSISIQMLPIPKSLVGGR